MAFEALRVQGCAIYLNRVVYGPARALDLAPFGVEGTKTMPEFYVVRFASRKESCVAEVG